MSEASHFGVCIRNDGCDDLQVRRLYQILPDEVAEASGLIRIIDDSGEDYLYPAENFIPLHLPPAVEKALAGIPAEIASR
jgi:hypothetical protein